MKSDSSLIRTALSSTVPFWRYKLIATDYILRVLHRINISNYHVAVFEIKDGHVDVWDKPAALSDGVSQDIIDDNNRRKSLYKSFFQDVVSELRLDIEIAFGMGLRDRALSVPTCPIFSFQRKMGERNLLVPDIDFLLGNFYAEDSAEDPISYYNKLILGVFAGSTTGSQHTLQSVNNKEDARLKAGLFFRNSPFVEFRLPRIVQCASDEARDAIKRLGFGSGHMSWTDQLKYRFLISIDGNGATCSRVAKALKSNSVLVKYDSPYELFYFCELIPFKHYLPVYSDRDVEDIVQTEGRSPGVYEDIAINASQFYTKNLTKNHCMIYTASLLTEYNAILTEGRRKSLITARKEISDSKIALIERPFVVAHIETKGDIRFDLLNGVGLPGSGLAIEGLSINIDKLLDGKSLVYQVVLKDGSLSNWAKPPEFCGTRGSRSPIIGFRAKLDKDASSLYLIRYFGTFLDKQTLGPFTDGEMCETSEKASIESLMFEILPRSWSGDSKCVADM